MKIRYHLVAAVLASAGCQPGGPPAPEPASGPPTIKSDIYYLADVRLGGRATGTPLGDTAAAFIARSYDRLGLHGAFETECAAPGARRCRSPSFQEFTAEGFDAHNVAVVVPGTDSALRDRYVIVGAHFDHLGRAPQDTPDLLPRARNARTPMTPPPHHPDAGLIRPGADDNASGTAAVMELGRRLAAHPARLSVLLVHFDAEEMGMLGSTAFVNRLPVPRQSIALMLNLDMIGRMRDGLLLVDTSGAHGAAAGLVATAAATAGLRVLFSSEETADRSDHSTFGHAGIPAVALFTGTHEDYHRATDTAERINYVGLGRVVDVAEAVVRALPAARP